MGRSIGAFYKKAPVDLNVMKEVTAVRISIFVFLAFISASCCTSARSETWPADKIAVSLSYDDAIESQLNHALPALNEHGFKASFYVVPASEVFQARLFEWRALAKQGHELGNHTLKHSCRGSLLGREWVEAERDLDKQSVAQLVTEVRIANTLLQALDGKTQRTLTLPCGDTLAGGESFVELIAQEFVAIKTLETPKGFSITHVPVNLTGEQLIALLTPVDESTRLINLIFHGVGGDYLSVSKDAHAQLLAFLANNQDQYWVDSYLNIMNAKAGAN